MFARRVAIGTALAVAAATLAGPVGAQGPPTLPAAPVPPPLLPPTDPGRDGWGPYGPPSPPGGLFVDAEVQLVRPALKDRIVNDAPLPNGATLAVPGADLTWTVAPVFEVGYRLPEGLGLLALDYRFLESDGAATVHYPDQGDFHLRTRLSLNRWGLDYGTAPFEFAPRWDFAWRVGVRLEDVFFDSRLQGAGLTQQASNNFLGAGPHARLELWRRSPALPGLALFGRLDGAVDIGRISQKFRDQSTNPGGSPSGAGLEQNSTQAVPTLTAQAGLTYAPPWAENLHFAVGYLYEHYWYLGQLGENSAGQFSSSRGELTSHGAFLRGQIDF
jgi:hypothetical protein